MTYGEIITEFEHQFPKFNNSDCRPYYPVENSLIFWNKGGEIAVTYKNGRFELIPNHAEYLSQEFYNLKKGEMKMYEVGDKFIIEIGEKYRTDVFDENGEINTPYYLCRIKGFNSLVFDENGLDRLTNYEDGFIAAFSNAMDKGYEKGLSDAWECAKKIYDLSFSNTKEIYGEENDSLLKVMRNLTPQEAIEKLKAWEEKQEIKVGDVVEVDEIGTFVITYIENENLYDCLKLGTLSGYTITDKSVIKKTGKHIDLTEIFKGLEGEDV